MARWKQRTSRFVGFTLVELLVVIGIIAVLISLLLPALNRARDQANTVACMSNMRQIGMAFQMYSNDNKGWIVPGGYRDGQNNEYCWPLIMVQNKYLPGQGLTITQNGADQQCSVSSAFLCPSMTQSLYAGYNQNTIGADGCWPYKSPIYDQVGSVDYPNGLLVWSSYGMDCQQPNLANYNCTTAEYLTTSTQSVGMHKITSIRDAVNHVILYDGYYIDPENSTNCLRIRPRHHRLKDTNLLYLDGHVDSVPRSSITTKVSDFVTAQSTYESPGYSTIKTPPYFLYYQP